MSDTELQYPGITRENIVGMRLKALQISGYERLNGTEFVVDRIMVPPTLTPELWTNGIMPKGRFNDPITGEVDLWVTTWEPVLPLADAQDGHTLTVSDPAPEPTFTQADIDRLQSRLDERARAYTNLDAEYQQAIETIGDRMVQEAENRGWCSEFNDIIREVNEDLPRYELKGCEQEYTVTWTETFTVTVHREERFTTTSPDEAISEAQEMDEADSDEIETAIGNGNWEHDSSDDYEVQ